MKRITTLLCLFFCSCTVTVGPSKQVHPSNHRVATTRNAPKTALVDSQWLARYREMESQSNYTIRQDSSIKPEGAKFRVPRAVIDHNADMSLASP